MKRNKSLSILKVWSTFQTEIKYHDHYLANCMQEEGHETTFFASDSVEPAWKPFLKKKQFDLNETWSGHNIQRFPSITIANKPFLKKPFKFIRAVKLKQPDIIHLLGLAYPVNQLALLASLLVSKAPVFVNEHGRLAANKNGWKAKLFYWNAYFIYQIFGRKKIKAFIAPNEESKAFIIDRYGVAPEKIHIIPLGFDKNIFSLQAGMRNQEKDKLILGFAGKINADKRVDRLLKALAYSRSKENILCKIAGFNESNIAIKNELESFAKEHQLNVEFLPFLNSEELAAFYNHIDVAVYPGSISITTIEANACGTPILLNNSIQGLEDRVADGRGFLFTTEEELRDKIEFYWTQKRTAQINHPDIANYTSKYSWRKISQEYLNLYYQYL
ncbi:MAG: glycosyltransferase family 4 protein [Chitinophagales bacterium]|nr:glycosyltransferase family 4 protein [Chitinophagales bacterium]